MTEVDKKVMNTGAYMTVEAAFIVPFVTLGIVFLIICGFYLYNVSYIKQTAYIAAVRGAAFKSNKNDVVESKTKKQLDILLENKLLMMGKPDYQVKVNYTKIKVSINAVMNIPVLSMISDKIAIWKIEADSEVIRDNPVEIIRVMRIKS